MSSPHTVPDSLPSTRTLLRSTFVALVIAGVLLVTVILPAEYGVDPVGAGKVLGLTEMGEIKMALAREAAAENATVVSSVSAGTSGDEWRDSITVSLAPNEGVEYKLEMTKGQQAMYLWTADSAEVSYNAHGEPPDAPKNFAHSYGRGQSRSMQGDLVAAFDGVHGWHWRNRSEGTVRVTLKTRGEYQRLLEIQ